LQLAAAIRKFAEPNFRALQVEQDAAIFSRVGYCCAHRLHARGVLLLISMGSIETEYIHSGREQLRRNIGRIGRGTQSGDDFGVGHGIFPCWHTVDSRLWRTLQRAAVGFSPRNARNEVRTGTLKRAPRPSLPLLRQIARNGHRLLTATRMAPSV